MCISTGIEGKLSYLNGKKVVDFLDKTKENLLNFVFNIDMKNVLNKKM